MEADRESYEGDMPECYGSADLQSSRYFKGWRTTEEVDIPYNFSDENLTVKRAMTVELLEKYTPGVWSFERIKQFGVYAVRGPRNMPAELKREMESEEASVSQKL